MDIEIIDNFIPVEIFNKEFKSIIKKIPWYTNVVLNEGYMGDPIDNFMLTHSFYKKYKPQSELFSEYIEPLLSHMQARSLIRVKANLTMRTEKIIKHGFHVDHKFIVGGEAQETNNCFTSILYLNTNDGYTQFENGTKIESIENRLITFPLSYRHTGTTCTNQPFRAVINFNYF
tara:strand:+ start:60 stop:581 length:522 start_codon:yes stop_codon:yes gene_type:complete